MFLINEEVVQDLSTIPPECNILLLSTTPKSFFWREVFRYHNLKRARGEKFIDDELEIIYKKLGDITKPKELMNIFLSRESVSALFERKGTSNITSTKGKTRCFF